MKFLRLHLARHRDALITFGSTLVLTMSVLTLIGHITGKIWLATWVGNSDMAPSTAACFAMISLMLMSMHGRGSYEQ